MRGGCCRRKTGRLKRKTKGLPVVAARRAFLAGTSFIYLKGAATKIGAVQGFDGVVALRGQQLQLVVGVGALVAEGQDFVVEQLTATENVDTVRTMLTIRKVKDDGLVELK